MKARFNVAIAREPEGFISNMVGIDYADIANHWANEKNTDAEKTVNLFNNIFGPQGW